MPKPPLDPHQKDALAKLSNGKVLHGGVGSGKSRVASTYYMNVEFPRDIYVITTAKKRDDGDWMGEFAKHAIGMHRSSSIGGILHVDSWNNVANYVDVEDAFFIFDEQRVVGSGTWVDSFLKITRKNHWILLSATPGDTWMDYVPLFVAKGWYKNRAEFHKEHVVWKPFRKFPQVDHYNGVGTLLRLRNELLVPMPYKKLSSRSTAILEASYDVDLYKQIKETRWNIFKDEPIRNSAQYHYLLRKVAYSDPSRLALVRETLKKHPRLIIFYNFGYELEILRQLSDETKVAEWNGQKHQDLPVGERWVYLVQYTAGAEGWECITTNATLFYSQTYSYKTWTQAHGRIDRMNSPYENMFYYTIQSKAPIERGVAKAISEKRNFNEAKWTETE